VDKTTDYRITINIQSQDYSELMYVLNEDFRHPLTAPLERLPLGFKNLVSEPGGLALDYIRGNLFDRDRMRRNPAVLPGPDNDLDDRFEHYVRRAMDDSEARIYAFGSRWGPESHVKDAYFGFLPGNGIHNIHMNQGSPQDNHSPDNGIYQDGALFFRFPASSSAPKSHWVAVFLKFQTQVWQTDDMTGFSSERREVP
jgi:uncharacterized protein YukJ